MRLGSLIGLTKLLIGGSKHARYFIRAGREKVGECLSVLLLSNVLYGTPVYHINGTDPAAWSLKIDRQVVWCDSDGKRLFSKEAASSSAARCRSATAEEIAA